MMTDTELLDTVSFEFDTLLKIVRITFHHFHPTDQDITRFAELFREQLLAMYADQALDEYCVLVDTSSVTEGNQRVTPEAREIYASLMDHDQTKKVAIISGGHTFSFMTKFILGLVLRKKNVQFFSDETLAVAWLQT